MQADIQNTSGSDEMRRAFFQYLLRLGDDRLVLGHRLSEWCGHAPILEEDVALANIALDCIGQGTAFLKLAAETQGGSITEDQLAYFRDVIDFRNAQIVELPRGDFAFTVCRQFLVDAFASLHFAALVSSGDARLAGIAEKAAKESAYHLRHSAEWVKRLGDGTEESHARLAKALDELWMYTGELFEHDALEASLVKAGFAVDVRTLVKPWQERVSSVLADAQIAVPPAPQYWATGGRRGVHTEHLGHLLAEMQSLQRAYPGAQW